MASDYPIWPLTVPLIPVDITLDQAVFVNKFGGRREQRIVNDIPELLANGIGGVTNRVGTMRFSLKHTNVLWSRAVNPINENLQDDFKTAWAFYHSLFYDNSTQQIRYIPFYWYNKAENDDLSTWTGSEVSNGTNGHGDAVTNATGRYLVRFTNHSLTAQMFKTCLFDIGLEVEEVAG